MTSTALLTDKYELTMLDAALKSGIAHKQSVFTAFTRSLPSGRRYGVFAGLGRVLQAIKDFTFTPEQINFLRHDGAISEETLDYLENYKFSGELRAYIEGETYYPHSPLITVKGTFAECVLLETVILSIINHDSAVAAAASRMTFAAKGRSIMEFGSRRTHESSAVAAARAAYIAGFAGTSNVQAGIDYGIPTMGTSAHAFTLAHQDEKEAFKAQVAALGVSTSLLVDTYDTEQGIKNAVEIAGTDLGGIRIDSGDLYEEAVKARALLDSLGAVNTKIIVSSDVDEYVMDDLVDRGAPIDSFGAGTRVVTGSGHPTCGMVYKLVAIEDNEGNMVPVTKNSHGKESKGGEKHVFRLSTSDGDKGEVVTTDLTYIPDTSWREVTATFIKDGEHVKHMSLARARGAHQYAMLKMYWKNREITAGAPALATVNEKGEVL
jgi:nicotinate phosphoribosyltransferase